ncbi:ATP-binding protein [Coleofasciculus sp. FACHB-1120]|uniref:ATP-binding protein n=1 Tax=Coleofasciculus sp. FACHB-1120 TaxID=2692783 RepID=UPI001688E86C|nr:ATP-binding protein [Coleofasciculus sp. FACHB-1120]MBD2742865.1 response regulator [Coleofasciculus sp. FACHB-1120]
MGNLMRSLDWSQTPLGDVTHWPQSLRSAVSILLPSKAQICLFWGPELIALYNDAYRPAIVSKHPWALGRPAHEVCSEVWDALKPLLEGVVTTGEAFWARDYLFFLNRYGYSEETYFDVSYDPVRDESGEVGGIFCIVSETTGRVLGDRRLQTLGRLANETAQAKTVEAACRTAIQALATNKYDIPFALLYRVEVDGKQATLVETAGFEAKTSATPTSVDLTQANDNWGLGQIYQTGQAVIVDVATRFGALPKGAWEKSPIAAWVVPLTQSGQPQIAGFLVLGINPHRAFENEYREFFDLVAGNVATAIANARAFEGERQRVEALAELDRAKTSFFSNISHEFRTPLTLMLSPLEQTLAEFNESIPTKARSQLELVQRNGKRLLKLVNTLLDFSRIEAGRTQANYEPTDLATYTAELASLFRSTVEQAGLQLTVDCPPLSEPIYIDRDMWEKIVLNLLSNAFKFTFEGEIAVVLRPVGDHVELMVRDTGTGIPAAELPKLFERFHRVEGARGRTFEGTGIGLSLVQELVHLQGGAIAVDSTLGQGSTFTVRLPMGTAHLASHDIHASHAQASTASGATSYVKEALGWLPEEHTALRIQTEENAQRSTSKAPPAAARILLVDDNADMRDYLYRLLSQFYQVEMAKDGETALASIYNHAPDLILSDVMMPGMDGFELLRQLRADSKTRELPFLLLSARAGEASAIEGLEAGADDYLVKPFSSGELLARVAANLELGRSRQAAARRRIDAVVSSVPDFIYTFDLAGRFTYINKPLLDLLQKTFAEAMGKNFFELDYPPELAARLQQQIQQVIATRQPLKDETPYTSAFGTRAYEYIFVPLFDADGAVEAVAGTSRDITEHKQIEVALRASEERYRMLFESIDEGFCVIEMLFDENGTPIDYRFLETNPVFEEQTGLEQASGKTALQLAPTLEKHWFEIYGKIAITGEPLRFENHSEALNRWFDVYAFRIGQPESHKVAILFKDISDRKRSEAEREQILQREQAARETAERANRIKDEFLAVLSHELRSPLNPILGWSQLLQSRKMDQVRTTYALQIIERNAKLQVQLIDDLLDVSRILQGKLSLNVDPVNLVTTITAALETVQLAAAAKSIQVQTILEPEVGQVLGDSGRLQQVIWNLLSNAVKFTPPQGRVEIRLQQIGAEAQITVSDTGKGILPQFLPYVFEYFRQADSATTRQFGGLGLGLAIVRQIVELHGGTVCVDSSGEGQGATFTVKFPLMSQHSALPQAVGESKSLSSLQGIKVLVVDDTTDMREYVTFVLEQEGAEVVAVASAAEALATLAQFQPTVLVSDIGMPDIDGYMLMRQVRALPSALGGQIPAIALTAYVGELNQQQAIAAGFQRHLSKPIEPTTLIAAIVDLIQKAN